MLYVYESSKKTGALMIDDDDDSSLFGGTKEHKISNLDEDIPAEKWYLS
jgi:hypothetical protein